MPSREASRALRQFRITQCISIPPPRPKKTPRQSADQARVQLQLVQERLAKYDRGQCEKLRLRLSEESHLRRCARKGCTALTKKTPLCAEHLAQCGLRIGRSTVCDGEGLFAVASPEALAAAAALGKRPEEVEVFGPSARYFICPYDGILLCNPDPHVLDQMEGTGDWVYCFKIDSCHYIDAALENFTGRFLNCAYPVRSRANARFSADTRRKTVTVRATKSIRHGQEILLSSYGGGYFPRLFEALEESRLGTCSRDEVLESEHTKRRLGRSDGGAPKRAAHGDGPAPPEPFPLDPRFGEWWDSPPVLRATSKRKGSGAKSKKRRAPGSAAGAGSSGSRRRRRQKLSPLAEIVSMLTRDDGLERRWAATWSFDDLPSSLFGAPVSVPTPRAPAAAPLRPSPSLPPPQRAAAEMLWMLTRDDGLERRWAATWSFDDLPSSLFGAPASISIPPSISPS
eukprot:tig00021338_g20370.t1